MEVFCTPVELHGRDESDQTIVMIAVQVTYKNMMDLVDIDLVPEQRVLRIFTAIQQ